MTAPSVRSRPFRIAIEGPSGAGKTSLAEALAARTGAVVLYEAWHRLTPRPSLAIPTPLALRRLELQLLREESLRWRESEALVRTGRSVVLDTGPLGPWTYVRGLGELRGAEWDVRPALRREFRGIVGLADAELYLDVPADRAARQAAGRGDDHPPEWRDRHAAVGVAERSFWLGTLGQLAPGRVWRIRPSASPARTASAVAARLCRRPPRPVLAAESRRVVAYLRGVAGEPAPATVIPRARVARAG
jgi:hypothetical protein